MDLNHFLKEQQAQLLIIENAEDIQDYAPVDLSETNLKAKHINPSNHEELQAYLDHLNTKNNSKVLYGGYLEKRNLYANSALFNSKSIRNIHLGLDLWAAAGTKIKAPLDAVLYAAHYNEGVGNYGGTIILKHQFNEITFFSLYGHLSKDSLNLNVGQSIKKNEFFCRLGNALENGNYVPHLHFQWIINLEVNAKDYPGVCSENQIKFFAKNSPKPELIFK